MLPSVEQPEQSTGYQDAMRRSSRLRCGRFELDLSQPKLMAIINTTPDSFSGDGLGGDLDRALARALAAIDAGAEILDIGGESTRPGAEPVSEQQELDRVIPLVERLAGGTVPVSVDTLKPGVMREAIRAGASMINDVNGFAAPGAVEAVVGSNTGLCVMHMRGQPSDMQHAPSYHDVVTEVSAYLCGRVDALAQAGVAAERIVIDPGFGFGKTLTHNLQLLKHLIHLQPSRFPVLVGMSRKSMLGAVTGRSVDERLAAGIAAAMIAVSNGARIVRVHDVAPVRDALAMWSAVHSV